MNKEEAHCTGSTLRRRCVVALCIVVLLIGIAAAEMVCRCTAIGVPWEADGLGRRRGLHASAPDSAPKIVCLGDSLTFGMRVREAESFPLVLGRLIGEGTDSPCVLNAGITGHTSVQTLERVERDALAFSSEHRRSLGRHQRWDADETTGPSGRTTCL